MKGNLEFCPLCMFQNPNTHTHTLFLLEKKAPLGAELYKSLALQGSAFPPPLQILGFFFLKQNKGCGINEFGPRGTFTGRSSLFFLVIWMLSCAI